MPDVLTVGLQDPKSRVRADYQNAASVREEVERLGIPRIL
jgi:hypothetical protein